MRIITSAGQMQKVALNWKEERVRVGLVPTMGYLHEGHISLVRKARQTVGKAGKIVLSIYVNPTQFGPGEDFGRYPRDLARDKALCAAGGVDLLFIPAQGHMYPSNPPYSTYVVEETLSKSMEGASRPTHFRGVTTVVAKLFNLVLPDLAVFGAKDFQQAAVVSKMTRDLNFPVRIVVSPTIREKDGLAMSSRNQYLSAGELTDALVLHRSLQLARKEIAAGNIKAPLLRKKMLRLILSVPTARVDYIEFFDPQSLHPVRVVKKGTQAAMAVFIGKTRLIDNATL